MNVLQNVLHSIKLFREASFLIAQQERWREIVFGTRETNWWRWCRSIDPPSQAPASRHPWQPSPIPFA